MQSPHQIQKNISIKFFTHPLSIPFIATTNSSLNPIQTSSNAHIGNSIVIIFIFMPLQLLQFFDQSLIKEVSVHRAMPPQKTLKGLIFFVCVLIDDAHRTKNQFIWDALQCGEHNFGIVLLLLLEVDGLDEAIPGVLFPFLLNVHYKCLNSDSFTDQCRISLEAYWSTSLTSGVLWQILSMSRIYFISGLLIQPIICCFGWVRSLTQQFAQSISRNMQWIRYYKVGFRSRFVVRITKLTSFGKWARSYGHTLFVVFRGDVAHSQKSITLYLRCYAYSKSSAEPCCSSITPWNPKSMTSMTLLMQLQALSLALNMQSPSARKIWHFIYRLMAVLRMQLRSTSMASQNLLPKRLAMDLEISEIQLIVALSRFWSQLRLNPCIIYPHALSRYFSKRPQYTPAIPESRYKPSASTSWCLSK